MNRTVNSLHGPMFDGDGGCLFLCHRNDPKNSYAKPTPIYPDTTGLGDALFTGAATFSLEDYEVWAAT
jgi:hypothetical protein